MQLPLHKRMDFQNFQPWKQAQDSQLGTTSTTDELPMSSRCPARVHAQKPRTQVLVPAALASDASRYLHQALFSAYPP